MKKVCTLVFLIIGPICLFSQNPLVTHMFTADPTARVFNDKLYVYPSSDMVPPKGKKVDRFCMPGYHMFSLENGTTWKDYGWVLKENDVPWGQRDTYAMWAPDCIKKGDKYYYFYPAAPKDKSSFRRIGVGVSDSPTGPFTWEKKYIDGVEGIDPGLLVDDNGKAYMYYAGGHEIQVVELKESMKKITNTPKTLKGLPLGYKEGPFPFKYNGKYYLTFAHVFQQEGYTIGYAIGDSPLGPFRYQGKIMDNIGNGTNHHSVVKYKGEWILFYHWWALSGHKRLRSMQADYLTFNKDGTIKKVKPSLRGIGTSKKGDTIQVDRHNGTKWAKIAPVGGNEPDGWMVTETAMMSYVRYNRVDFGKKGSVQKIKARIASGHRIGKMMVYLDSEKGKKIAEYDITNTGGWNSWVTLENELLEQVEGIHDIFVVFSTEWGDTKLVNLNWLLFE